MPTTPKPDQDDALAEIEQLTAANAALTAERDMLTAASAALTTERDAALGQVASLTAERDTLAAANASLTAERDALHAMNTTLATECDEWKAKAEPLQKQLASGLAKHGVSRKAPVATIDNQPSLTERTHKIVKSRYVA